MDGIPLRELLFRCRPELPRTSDTPRVSQNDLSVGSFVPQHLLTGTIQDHRGHRRKITESSREKCPLGTEFSQEIMKDEDREMVSRSVEEELLEIPQRETLDSTSSVLLQEWKTLLLVTRNSWLQGLQGIDSRNTLRFFHTELPQEHASRRELQTGPCVPAHRGVASWTIGTSDVVLPDRRPSRALGPRRAANQKRL